MQATKRIIIAALAIFFISSLTKNLLEYRRNVAFYEEYKAEYLKEKKHNEELKTEYVKTQDSYEFEKTVRNKLNLHKKDEVILVIPEPTATPIITTPSPIPNYKQWINVLF